MFKILDDKGVVILEDEDRDRLRLTALLLVKEISFVVKDYDEEGNEIGEHTEHKYVRMFDEETVDEAIIEDK